MSKYSNDYLLILVFTYCFDDQIRHCHIALVGDLLPLLSDRFRRIKIDAHNLVFLKRNARYEYVLEISTNFLPKQWSQNQAKILQTRAALLNWR